MAQASWASTLVSVAMTTRTGRSRIARSTGTPPSTFLFLPNSRAEHGAELQSQHIVAVARDHDAILVPSGAHARLVIDTRSIFTRKGLTRKSYYQGVASRQAVFG